MREWALVLIAIIASTIAYFQWVTAHQRIILDLFQRRLDVFNDLEDSIISVLREAACSDDAFRQFNKARFGARFLFGEEVQEKMAELGGDFVFFHVYKGNVVDEFDATEKKKYIERKYKTLEKFSDLPKTLTTMFAPYMNLTAKQKNLWSPF